MRGEFAVTAHRFLVRHYPSRDKLPTAERKQSTIARKVTKCINFSAFFMLIFLYSFVLCFDVFVTSLRTGQGFVF